MLTSELLTWLDGEIDRAAADLAARKARLETLLEVRRQVEEAPAAPRGPTEDVFEDVEEPQPARRNSGGTSRPQPASHPWKRRQEPVGPAGANGDGKAEAGPGASGGARRTPAEAEAVRRRLAVWLAEHGPTTSSGLWKACGLAPGSFYRLVKHPWFEQETDGWHLTTAGLQAVRGNPEED